MDTEVDFPVGLGDGRRGCRFAESVQNFDRSGTSMVTGSLVLDDSMAAADFVAEVVVDTFSVLFRWPTVSRDKFVDHARTVGGMLGRQLNRADGTALAQVRLDQRDEQLFGQVQLAEGGAELVLPAALDVEVVSLRMRRVR